MSLKRQKQNRTSPELDFNPWDYKENKWCFDTPGTVCNDQIINFLTQEEIKNVMPALPMTPRSLNVKKGHSVLIGNSNVLLHSVSDQPHIHCAGVRTTRALCGPHTALKTQKSPHPHS